ncbi:MAG: nitroreductase family protein [Clostridiales bacterium]|mgnify:FL=1|nr:nitroreductase family protein [Clostridiales bacterium]
MAKDFYTAIKERRSIYSISNETTISDNRLEEVVKEAVLHAPSAFNSQTARVLLLLGENHHKLWNITAEALKKIVASDRWPNTETKINSFKAGYGTILFFEDMSIVESLQQKFPTYKENFPLWSQQSSGILQYIIWTALELEGLGASLQHYNELIEEQVKRQWNVPANWKLISQMPFGKPTATAGEKEFMPLEERLKIYK